MHSSKSTTELVLYKVLRTLISFLILLQVKKTGTDILYEKENKKKIFDRIYYIFKLKMSAPYTKLDKPLDENAVLCRGCLVESGEMKNIFEWGLADDFFKFTLLQVCQLLIR